MFYADFICTKRGGQFGLVWRVATKQGLLNRREYMSVKVSEVVQKIIDTIDRRPSRNALPAMSLRMASILMFGCNRVYNRQVCYLCEDLQHMIWKAKSKQEAARGVLIDLPDHHGQVTQNDPMEDWRMNDPFRWPTGKGGNLDTSAEMDFGNEEHFILGKEKGTKTESPQVPPPGSPFQPVTGDNNQARPNDITLPDHPQDTSSDMDQVPGNELPHLSEEELAKIREEPVTGPSDPQRHGDGGESGGDTHPEPIPESDPPVEPEDPPVHEPDHKVPDPHDPTSPTRPPSDPHNPLDNGVLPPGDTTGPNRPPSDTPLRPDKPTKPTNGTQDVTVNPDEHNGSPEAPPQRPPTANSPQDDPPPPTPPRTPNESPIRPQPTPGPSPPPTRPGEPIPLSPVVPPPDGDGKSKKKRPRKLIVDEEKQISREDIKKQLQNGKETTQDNRVPQPGRWFCDENYPNHYRGGQLDMPHPRGPLGRFPLINLWRRGAKTVQVKEGAGDEPDPPETGSPSPKSDSPPVQPTADMSTSGENLPPADPPTEDPEISGDDPVEPPVEPGRHPDGNRVPPVVDVEPPRETGDPDVSVPEAVRRDPSTGGPDISGTHGTPAHDTSSDRSGLVPEPPSSGKKNRKRSSSHGGTSDEDPDITTGPPSISFPDPSLPPLQEEDEKERDQEPLKDPTEKEKDWPEELERLIEEKTSDADTTTFKQVCPTSRPRNEAAILFYTLLVLCKEKTVRAKQQEPYGDINISRGPKWGVTTEEL